MPECPDCHRAGGIHFHCPACFRRLAEALTADQLRSARGKINAALRTVHHGGRKRKPRCQCGAMTQDQAAKRGHECEVSNVVD